MLQGLEELINWSQMDFKPAKPRALVMRKGKVTDKFCFSVGGIPIPSVTEKPVKNLGRMFDSTLKDTAAFQVTNSELGNWPLAG